MLPTFFLKEKEQTLLFGRDCLGRRSLMWRQTEDAFMLSSVGLAEPGAEWQEVPATGFFYIKFGETVKEPAFTACGYPVQLIPWVYDSKADENSMVERRSSRRSQKRSLRICFKIAYAVFKNQHCNSHQSA